MLENKVELSDGVNLPHVCGPNRPTPREGYLEKTRRD